MATRDPNAVETLATPSAALGDHLSPAGEPAALAIPGAALPGVPERRLRAPQWAVLLLRNPKSCFGIVTIVAMVVIALLAPVIAQNSPSEIVALPGQPPNRDFWFGTTDQGYDVFSQVVWGARTSLAVGAAAALLSTVIAATLGMLAAYAGGWIDDTINLITNIFLVIPALPLLIVVYSFVPARGPLVMVLILGLTTWAVEARILRGQALSLTNRDFIQAAKVSGEGTWRIVFGEIMPNMVSRIAAGFLLVFYLSIIFAAGLEFLGFGDVNKVTWGTTLYWAQNNSTVLQGAWWHFVFPGVALALAVAALVFINYGVDELANPRLRRPRARRGALARALWRPDRRRLRIEDAP
jgi:peptide/nickel transport system permease protein